MQDNERERVAHQLFEKFKIALSLGYAIADKFIAHKTGYLKAKEIIKQAPDLKSVKYE